MDQNCKIVQDLLPLYIDDVCSEDSKTYVNNHIKDCPECSEYLNKLNNNSCVESIKDETADVVAHHSRKQKRASTIVGMVFAGILMIPVIVCMIVNLAVGHGLSWFFIVLTSLLVFASITTVPLLVYRNKLLWTIGSFTASVILNLAVICIYTHGNWFFIAASGTLLGIAIPALPIVASRINSGFFSKNKGLLILGTYTILLYALFISISCLVSADAFWTVAGPVSGVCLVFIWVIFAIARYLKASKMTKAGLIIVWCGLCFATVENIVFMLMGYSVVWHAFHPLSWNTGLINANLHWVVGTTAFVVGLILTLCGLKKNKITKFDEE